jgi:tetratricopeptide (TPR) repeat protein
MIALRVVVATLMLGVAPQPLDAQRVLPEVGVVPSDWHAHGRALVAANRHREAIAAFQRAIQLQKGRSEESAWLIARSYAQLGNRKQAFRWVEHAIELGFSDRDSIRKAPEFAKFRDDPRLDQLLRPLVASRVQVAMLTSYF